MLLANTSLEPSDIETLASGAVVLLNLAWFAHDKRDDLHRRSARRIHADGRSGVADFLDRKGRCEVAAAVGLAYWRIQESGRAAERADQEKETLLATADREVIHVDV
jgi:hypothetical protein